MELWSLTGNSQQLASTVNGVFQMRRGSDGFGATLLGNFTAATGIRGRNASFGFGRYLRVGGGDGSNVGKKPITSPRNGLDEARILRRIAERFANLVDRLVDAVIEVDDDLAPDFLAQFLPGYQLAGLFEQHGQDLKRLLLQPDAPAALRQFAGSKIDLEDSKA